MHRIPAALIVSIAFSGCAYQFVPLSELTAAESKWKAQSIQNYGFVLEVKSLLQDPRCSESGKIEVEVLAGQTAKFGRAPPTWTWRSALVRWIPSLRPFEKSATNGHHISRYGITRQWDIPSTFTSTILKRRPITVFSIPCGWRPRDKEMIRVHSSACRPGS